LYDWWRIKLDEFVENLSIGAMDPETSAFILFKNSK